MKARMHFIFASALAVGLFLTALPFAGGCGNSKKNKKKKEQILIAISMGGTGPTIHVSPAGDDLNNGLSWESAAKTIQKGIDLGGRRSTIIVADGTYTGTGNKNLDFNGKALHLKSENGSDVCIVDCEGSGRWLYLHDVKGNASIVDGFTVTGGVAGSDCGGAIYCYASNLTITNCTFDNNAAFGGGAIYCEISTATITNCSFANNGGFFGGAIEFWYSSSTITNCTFDNNSANSAGAILCGGNADHQITNNVFTYNTAAFGGAIITSGDSPAPPIENCTFISNKAAYGGGAIIISGRSTPIANCIFISNQASYGGAIECNRYGSMISNCTFDSNIAHIATGTGGAIHCVYGCLSTISNCSFTSNMAGAGGAINCLDSNELISNSLFNLNIAEAGGAISLSNSNSMVANCSFGNNSAIEGGGILCAWNSNSQITNCTFESNTADNGGGIYCSFGSSNPILRNCIIWNNMASENGSQCYIYDVDSSITMKYCCYDNSMDHIAGLGADNLDYSDNCIFSDPQFQLGSQMLSSFSPCIDAGNNTYVDELGITMDLLGLPRKIDGDGDTIDTVDIGAYEYRP